MEKLLALRWYVRWPLLLATATALGALITVVIHVEFASRTTVDGRRLSWLDWITVVGLPLAALGVGITLVQVLKATSAADSARQAVDRALGALGRSELIIDLETIRRLEAELLGAAGADRTAIQRLVREVRETSARVESVLKAKHQGDPMIGEIEAVRTAATEARRVIMGGRSNLNAWNQTSKLREEMAQLCDSIAVRVNDLRLDVRGDAGDVG